MNSFSPRVTHISLAVRDVSESVAFYIGCLGFPAGERKHGGQWIPIGEGIMLVLMSADQLTSSLGARFDASGGVAGVLFSHNVASSSEVESRIDQAARYGGRILRAAHEVSWGGVIGLVCDPDEHRWEIVWNPHACHVAD